MICQRANATVLLGCNGRKIPQTRAVNGFNAVNGHSRVYAHAHDKAFFTNKNETLHVQSLVDPVDPVDCAGYMRFLPVDSQLTASKDPLICLSLAKS